MAGTHYPPSAGETAIQTSTGIINQDGSFDAFPTVTPEGVDLDTARQSESTAMNDDYVAWVETPSTDLYYDDWSVFAADIATGTTVALGASVEVLPDDTLPIVGPYTYVTVGDTRAWWGTPYPLGDKGEDGHYSDFGLEILGRNLDGSGELEVVAKGAILPSASGGDCVAFVRVNGTDTSVADGTYVISEVCEDGVEHRLIEGELGPDGRISDLAAGDGLLAWSIRENDDEGMPDTVDVLIFDRATGTLTDISQIKPENNFLDVAINLAVGDGTVQWNCNRLFLYDTVTSSLWKLPGSGDVASNAQIQGGAWLGWVTFSGTEGTTTVGRWEH
ncbi:hypothetical protein [Demequina sp. NBRC 110054]|uniref:hypothetical protein n=1 Tax=Demequina sp. NBRC 110054 TaxID=1570343 RepID=UPI000A02CF88|nr:hypothetical protein [Demequina sp. NBRC 110054]